MQDILTQVLNAFDGQKRDLEIRIEDVEAKKAAVLRALEMDGSSLDRTPSVPDDKYEEVLSYLRKHPDSRQADMARDLKLNSGIISSAMKIALGRHEVMSDKEGRGARYKAADR